MECKQCNKEITEDDISQYCCWECWKKAKDKGLREDKQNGSNKN